jgi:hypothetical protein
MDHGMVRELCESFHGRLLQLEMKLDAPVPSWVEYDDAQKQHFDSAEAVERRFKKISGKKIRRHYLQNFGNMLDELNLFITTGESLRPLDGDFYLASSSVFIATLWLHCHEDTTYIKLNTIETRPCAESLAFARIFLWQLMQGCIQMEYDLLVLDPVEKTRGILRRISPAFRQLNKKFGQDYIDCMEISVHDMRELKLANFGIQHLLEDFDPEEPWIIELDPSRFPTAAQLNDQEAVDARKTKNDTHKTKNDTVT